MSDCLNHRSNGKVRLEQPAKTSKQPEPELITPPAIEPDEGIIGGSALEETSSAHEIMAVITPWTEPILAYLLCKELLEDQTYACATSFDGQKHIRFMRENYTNAASLVCSNAAYPRKRAKELLSEIHFWHVWPSRSTSDFCKQSFPSRVLLAHCT